MASRRQMPISQSLATFDIDRRDQRVLAELEERHGAEVLMLELAKLYDGFERPEIARELRASADRTSRVRQSGPSAMSRREAGRRR